MGDEKKTVRPGSLSDLPDGLKELVEMPVEEKQAAIMLPAANPQPALPSASAVQPSSYQPGRQKTPKELELDALIASRRGIIDKLKEKNPLVMDARKKLAELVPAIRGQGASHTMKLAAEAEHIEFSIATEAYTPKKEKDLIKHLRGIRKELARHREADDARKAVDAKRHELHAAVSEIRELEHELDSVREKCDTVYGEILAERKAAYEQRERGREERKARQLAELQQRVKQERIRQHDDELKPYLKDYDDTVSMDEICQIEKREKKDDGKNKG